MTWSDPFDELAALFLTDPDESAQAETAGPDFSSQAPVAAAAPTELIAVGNLPVRATLWLTAYADGRARELGPTSLVRLDDDEPSIQVLRGPASSALRRYETLPDAIADFGPQIALWVIRPPLDSTPLDLLQSGCDRITILTSASETARVDAYQRIKTLIETAQQSGAALPALGVAVVGCDRQTAVAVQHQLNQTATEYLGVEVPLVAAVHRIDAAIRSADVLTSASRARPPLESVLGWIAGSAAARPKQTAPPRPVPQVTTHAAQRAGVEWDAPTPPVKLPPKPAVEIEPKTPAGSGEPDARGAPVALAAYVEDLTPLDVRCPGHERLEIGVDVAGRLHVIAREEHMRHLQVVESWAAAHRELIEKACPGHWIDPAGKTICHVFTAEPATLADLHGSALRLHVLTPVTVDGKRGWYAAPLNAAVR